eukprot:6069383-Amphidinium_carterae.1
MSKKCNCWLAFVLILSTFGNSSMSAEFSRNAICQGCVANVRTPCAYLHLVTNLSPFRVLVSGLLEEAPADSYLDVGLLPPIAVMCPAQK